MRSAYRSWPKVVGRRREYATKRLLERWMVGVKLVKLLVIVPVELWGPGSKHS